MAMHFAGAAHRSSLLLKAPKTYLGTSRQTSCANSGKFLINLLNLDYVGGTSTPSISINRHYSSTPILSRRSRPRHYQSETMKNEKLEKNIIIPKSEKIHQLKRKIKDLSQGIVRPEPKKQPPRTEPKKKTKPRHRDRDRLLEEEAPRPSGEKKRNSTYHQKQHKHKEVRTRAARLNPLRAPFSIFVSCLPGLEPLLLQEVEYLQSQWEQSSTAGKKSKRNKKHEARTVRGGVKLMVPTLPHLYTLHLYLGTASHIYLRLNDDMIDGSPLFRARGFPELKRKLKDLMLAQQWDQLLNVPSSKSKAPWELQLHVTTSKSKLMHTKAVKERVMETMEDVLGIHVFKSASSEVPGGGKDTSDRPIVRLFVRIDRDEVQVSLDASSSSAGTPLHMRGYRLNPFKAPLREDLAFALVMAGGLKPSWNLDPLQSTLWNGVKSNEDSVDTPIVAAADTLQLFDPFCGSGTIAIEGASILAGLPPGRFRSPPLLGTALCDSKLWDAMKSKALSVSSSELGNISDGEENDNVLVAANDINKEAINAAKSNAERAGVEQFIDFTTGSFKTHPILKPSRKSVSNTSESNELLVVTNPPYGKRLSTPNASSASTYKQFAKSLNSSSRKVDCTMIGKDIRALRESALPLKVAFSTKQGGLSVVAMTGSIDKDNSE